MKRSTYIIGREAECLAEAWYQGEGYQTVARNFRGRGGEIDLILRKGDELLVVEVKGRKDFCLEDAWQKRWRLKKKRIIRTLRYFLASSAGIGISWSEIRLEIVFITQGRVKERFQEELFF